MSVIAYLDHAAASDHGRRYKDRLFALLGVGEGGVALDIGCGPGTDPGPLADPDWDSLAIDDIDLETSRAYTRHVSARVVRNAVIGRQLARLADDAGLACGWCRPSR